MRVEIYIPGQMVHLSGFRKFQGASVSFNLGDQALQHILEELNILELVNRAKDLRVTRVILEI